METSIQRTVMRSVRWRASAIPGVRQFVTAAFALAGPKKGGSNELPHSKAALPQEERNGASLHSPAAALNP